MTVCDLIIRDGMIYDGTGSPPRSGSIAIDRDRIVAVGDVSRWHADQEIAADGLAVSPGFIDVHTHDDWAALKTPEMPFKITQGVTTIIAGNCGISAAPLQCDGELPPPFTTQDLRDGDLYPDVRHYAAAVDQASPATNVALLVGHSSLRVVAMGDDLDRPATETERETMSALLDQALHDGAIGLSSGLEYPPAQGAPIDEMISLARVLGGHAGAIYTSHIRDEGDELIAAVQEALETGRQASAALVISHHKCAGEKNIGKSVETLAAIDEAQKSQSVAFDVYPYVASSSSLLKQYLRDADAIKVMWSTPYPDMGGRMLNDIAATWGVSREEAVDRLYPAGAIYFDMDESDLRRIMSHPKAMIGSDGIPGMAKPHPRLWGTFPRVLGHYARDLGLFSLSEAIHKMTGQSATTFGLTDRGVIREGAKADIVIFDPETVIDRATFDDSEVPAQGIRHVLVNGVPALADGALTGQRAGGFIRRP